MSQSKLLQKLVAHSLKFLLWLMLCSLQDNYKGVIAEGTHSHKFESYTRTNIIYVVAISDNINLINHL
jgi:hypothetical protein